MATDNQVVFKPFLVEGRAGATRATRTVRATSALDAIALSQLVDIVSVTPVDQKKPGTKSSTGKADQFLNLDFASFEKRVLASLLKSTKGVFDRPVEPGKVLDPDFSPLEKRLLANFENSLKKPKKSSRFPLVLRIETKTACREKMLSRAFDTYDELVSFAAQRLAEFDRTGSCLKSVSLTLEESVQDLTFSFKFDTYQALIDFIPKRVSEIAKLTAKYKKGAGNGN